MRTMRIRLNYITPVLAAGAIAAALTAAAAVPAQQAAIATAPIAVTDHVVPAARGGGGGQGGGWSGAFKLSFCLCRRAQPGIPSPLIWRPSWRHGTR
jgi:hypothetical protein